MADLNTPMFSYKQYVNDKQQLKQTGTIDANIQKQSPKSPGSRGLRKTHEFTNTTVTLMDPNSLDGGQRPQPANPNPKSQTEK
jgi:hypothetical protein